MFKLYLEKVEESDQIGNTHWIIEKARECQKNIYFYFIDYTKTIDYVDHKKLWKILKEVNLCVVVRAYRQGDYSRGRCTHSR